MADGYDRSWNLLIIASSTLAAERIRHGLRYVPGCRVLGFASSSQPCDAVVRRTRADIVLVEDAASEAAVLVRIREVRAAAPAVKIVLLSRSMDPARLASASQAGVDAAVSASAAPFSVGMLVREVAAGHVFHAFAEPPTAPAGADNRSPLTTRETEILRLVAAGLPNRRIADQLFVTEPTVKFHLSNVFRKLGLSNRTEASRYAHLHDLLAVDPHDRSSRLSDPLAA